MSHFRTGRWRLCVSRWATEARTGARPTRTRRSSSPSGSKCNVSTIFIFRYSSYEFILSYSMCVLYSSGHSINMQASPPVWVRTYFDCMTQTCHVSHMKFSFHFKHGLIWFNPTKPLPWPPPDFVLKDHCPLSKVTKMLQYVADISWIFT